MFKRLFSKLFPAPPMSDQEIRDVITSIREDLGYVHELKVARARGDAAIMRFYAEHPEEFFETIGELERSNQVPAAMLSSMISEVMECRYGSPVKCLA